MKSQFIGVLLVILFTTTMVWGQKFCTCQLEQLTEMDSDTIIYRASLTIFPEAVVQEVYFGILKAESIYHIQPDVGERMYYYDEAKRDLSDDWRSFGRAVSLRSSLLSILSKDLFSIHCASIYPDDKTYDFSSVLTSIYKSQ